MTAAGLAIPRRSVLARGLVLGLAGAAALALLTVLAVLAVLSAVIETTAPPSAAPTEAGIPEVYVPMYQAAGAEYQVSWFLLASIHKQETDFTRSNLPGVHAGVNSAGCCAGPMQFNVTDGTWDRYGSGFAAIAAARPAHYPQLRQPHPSVYDDYDAIAAAAKKLHADGATASLDSQGTYRAVCAYIGSCSAVASCGGPNAYCQVLPRAKAWQQQARAEHAAAGTPDGAPLIWPVQGSISSRFCESRSWEACHPGIDVAVPSGTAVLAAADGRVSLTQPEATSGGYGNFTCLAHADGISTCYAHQARILVTVGQFVRQGQVIGISDCTGRCYGPHLHFEVRRADGTPICPAPYLGLSPSELCDGAVWHR